MSDFVLVHCAQGGGWAWKFVAGELRARGHGVWAPSLTGLGDRKHLARPDVNLDTHIEDIVQLIQHEDLTNVVLVGWSYGGIVVTGVADQLPNRLSHVIYLDAEVPEHGHSLFDIAGEDFRRHMQASAERDGDGWRASFGSRESLDAEERLWIPDAKLRGWYLDRLVASPQPVETYRQPIHLTNHEKGSVARTFIRCTADGSSLDAILGPIAGRFKQHPIWRYREIDTNHCGPLVAPQLVANALVAASS
ncbi:esterase [Nitratireductor aestuarii]|uniref:Esterase n=1 Tax=Nitratireductor aestuarii TaxID=1735103 RepID=A0A916RD58_9HYPH|nr:alpha/beta hydrolase [Nitratireductor aestuarii]GGA51328.1 esterase [Nitratireductor aestuarii]